MSTGLIDCVQSAAQRIVLIDCVISGSVQSADQRIVQSTVHVSAIIKVYTRSDVQSVLTHGTH